MNPRRRGAFALALAGAVLVLAGCSGPVPYDSEYPYTTADIDASRDSAGAPVEFRDRASLPSCPDTVVKLDESILDSAIACVEHAGAVGAELAVVWTTTEGDPVVEYYRAGPGISGIEIWIDMTRDAFGSGWHLTTCATLSVERPDGCTTVDYP